MIKVYSTPKCPACVLLKAWLENKGVKYKDVDVSKSQEHMIEVLKETGKRTVPVINVDGKFITGFDEEELNKVIK